MKTAYEIAMEKLRGQDAARGKTEKPLTSKQKDEIAEIRRVHQAKLAEREILSKSELQKARASGDPEVVRTAEEACRRDRARIEEEMESKIRDVRGRRK
ncbi:MAG TPA: hypothetical protein VFG76_04650 [Candidatus Polarisedimenticolia bacterium]|nr:hypothetical protein [Candidatus Polarisedimenticolia bacterium]